MVNNHTLHLCMQVPCIAPILELATVTENVPNPETRKPQNAKFYTPLTLKLLNLSQPSYLYKSTCLPHTTPYKRARVNPEPEEKGERHKTSKFHDKHVI